MSDESAGRVVEAHEASISTATVEVKTLTIKGRQLTLSVFRQIVREPIIVESADGVKLAGQPWGRVQYHPAPCDNKGDTHLHVIWQKGGELRRACVDPVKKAVFAHGTDYSTYGKSLPDYGGGWVAWLCRWMIATGFSGTAHTQTAAYEAVLRLNAIHRYAEDLRRYRNRLTTWEPHPPQNQVDYWKGIGSEFPQSLDEAKAALDRHLSHDGLGDDIDNDVRLMRDREKGHECIYKQLQTEIPQLFIAV